MQIASERPEGLAGLIVMSNALTLGALVARTARSLGALVGRPMPDLYLRQAARRATWSTGRTRIRS